MESKEYKIGYLTKTIYTDNTGEEATALPKHILAGETAYGYYEGTGNQLVTGTIPTYHEDDALSYIQYHANLRGGNLDYFWYGYTGTEIHIPKGALKDVTSLRYAFSGCPNLTTVYAYAEDISKVENLDGAFSDSNIRDWTTIAEPAMFKLRKRAIDPWDTIEWSTFNLPNLQLSRNTFSKSKFKNLKIANTSKIKNISNTFKDMPELESLYITDCNNVENDSLFVQSLKCVNGDTGIIEGYINVLDSKTMNQLATAPKLKKLRMAQFVSPSHIQIGELANLEDLELNDMHNLVTCTYKTQALPKLKSFKLTGVQNLENISNFVYGENQLESFELYTDYKSNISISRFTLKDSIVTNPSASLFAEGNIIYCVDTKKYYKNTIIDGVKTWKSFIPTELQGNAPYLTILNYRHDTISNLNCMPGMIVYFKPEDKYYKWYKGTWEETSEPTEYPLKQSTYYLRGAQAAFAGATKLKNVCIDNATQLGFNLCAFGSSALTGSSKLFEWLRLGTEIYVYKFDLDLTSPNLSASKYAGKILCEKIETEYTYYEKYWESMYDGTEWYWHEYYFNEENTPLNNMFQGCVNIESIRLPGISVSFSIKDCVNMTREAIIVLLEDLAPVYSCTLELGTLKNKLTVEDIKIATDKGWNIT